MGLKKIMVGLMLAAVLLLNMAVDVAAKETVKIGMAVSWPGYAFYEIARQKNLAPDYDIEIVIFEDPIGGHSALAAGQVDVYLSTGDYTPIAIDGGTDAVNVAFLNPSYGVDQVILAPGIASAADLKGKKMAAPQAFIGHLLTGMWLDKQGLAMSDVEWVNLNADEAVGPIMSGDLAAAYVYEPWTSKVTANLEGSTIVADTSQPEYLDTGVFMDVMYMNKNFIKDRRQAALDIMKLRWDALQYWHDNTEEVNVALAEFLQWPAEDIGFVIGTNGKSFLGGIYMMDFDEAARVCGVLDGKPPFGLINGGMADVVKLTNEWWIKLGLMTSTVDASKGVDCSILGDLVKQGYRQSMSAR